MELTSQARLRLLRIATEPDSKVFHELRTGPEGLTDRQARTRLKEFGPNVVVHERRSKPLTLFIRRLANPLVLLLLVLAVVSIFIGDAASALMMLLMILIGVSLGAAQESKSNRAAAKLQAMVSTSATVLRRPQRQKKEIPQSQLVPGDIVTLSAGDLVPADVRLLSSKDLSLSQAALTGESLPVDKNAAVGKGDTKNPFEIPNLCFMGTNVLSGTAEAVVVLTGKDTYLGALADRIVGQRAQTSFEKGINDFTWLMIRFILVMAPLVFVINGFFKHQWFEALLFALAVAVGLTPEMLPMIVTVNLAKGALEMSKRKVIVKRLNSIQNFGGMDVLCSDKTGTITRNRVILERYIGVYGNPNMDVLKFAYLNSLHQTGLKNLLDVAVLSRADSENVRQIKKSFEKVDEIPFDFQRKKMSVVVRDKTTGDHWLVCKGAVDEVFASCIKGAKGDQAFPLDKEHRALLDQISRGLNEEGFRVVAVAYKKIPDPRQEYSVKDEGGLTLVGYLAFLDPPKETAFEAVRSLAKAGVGMKILTGDNEIISRKICRDVGLNVEQVLAGPDLDGMNDEALGEAAEKVSVMVRLTPEQKARVIQVLQKRGHVVGFLGDGINDGPALRKADVGISVDDAVDIAKESADIILLEKNLLVLKDGILEGRRVFANIVKYIKMNASSNFGNMLSVLGASAFLPFLPMQPIQVIANNFLYDMSQTAIPTDNVDPEFLESPQRWKIQDLRKFILYIGPVSSVFDYTTFFVMLWIFHAAAHPALFQTGWFVESIATQTLIIHVIRTNKIPFFQSRASWPLILTSGLIILIGAWLPFSYLARWLKLAPLPHAYWFFLLGILVSYVVLTQFIKVWLLRLPSRQLKLSKPLLLFNPINPRDYFRRKLRG